ncbi:MAG: class I SAM-dependent methyltransferase [Flavisolibacter sp.]|nr:class I SAM-dependent methyltransferase [Flavisolibacter sp.]
MNDLRFALNKADVYWMHPVERKYENVLRKSIRQQFNHYVQVCSPGYEEESTDVIGPMSAFKKMKEIKGWLEEKEADLLMATALKAGIKNPGNHTIVEIGAYEGKATVLLGTVVKEFFPGVKIAAIDPHDGRLGALDQELITVEPSLTKLRANIESAGLQNVVEIIQAYSYDVKWETPISFLIIDGLHDYPSVARDFWHFSAFIDTGGYIAFHDYADYYPGVQAFVEELLESKSYRKVQKADSLIVLQKT